MDVKLLLYFIKFVGLSSSLSKMSRVDPFTT